MTGTGLRVNCVCVVVRSQARLSQGYTRRAVWPGAGRVATRSMELHEATFSFFLWASPYFEHDEADAAVARAVGVGVLVSQQLQLEQQRVDAAMDVQAPMRNICGIAMARRPEEGPPRAEGGPRG